MSSNVTALRSTGDSFRDERVALAAAFRLAARHDWHEAVANHLSLAVGEDGTKFLMNPRWRHFARMRASDLLLLDSNDAGTLEREDAPDVTAWHIHGALHRLRPDVRCVLHLHPPYATALASLQDMRILPIDQNTARFYDKVSYDDAYGGLARDDEEGERLAHALGENSILMMANHGVLVTAPSVAQAFDDLYYLERAARTLMLAYAGGRPLRVLGENVAAEVAGGWRLDVGFAEAHFAEARALLDSEGADYAV